MNLKINGILFIIMTKTNNEKIERMVNNMKVKDCMESNVFFVTPETNVQDVVKLMSANHIGCVPVCNEKNNVCGIITDRDILLRSVACNKDTNTTPISEIMTTKVCTCKDNENITEAQNKMGNNQIRRLPVCDENNKLVGILTLGNLSQNDNEIGTHEVCNTLNNICNCDENKNAQ